MFFLALGVPLRGDCRPQERTSAFLVGECLQLLLNPAWSLPGGHVAPATFIPSLGGVCPWTLLAGRGSWDCQPTFHLWEEEKEGGERVKG